MTAEKLATMTVAQIRDLLDGKAPAGESLTCLMEADPRAGVRRLARSARRRKKALAEERARLERMCAIETELRDRGDRIIAGVDEAGRGPLAGPVVAAAVVLPPGALIEGLNDSKKLSEARRESLFDRIHATAEAVGVGCAEAEEIDRINIRNATHLAMRRALKALGVRPDRVLVDGNAVPESPFSERAVIGGDRLSLSIAAASVIAKVTRDRQMRNYDAKFPAYGFAQHKGYGSAEHLSALRQHGPCPIHRKTFGGVVEVAQDHSEDFPVFAEGIRSASTMGELNAIGKSIASASDLLPPKDVADLRSLFRKKRTRLSHPGRAGEELAAQHLERKGFNILARRYRTGGGEIDIVAQRAHTLAFVEVKTATNDRFGPPESWVTPAKLVQIREAAKAFLQDHPPRDLALRFDVIAIQMTGDTPGVRHIEGVAPLWG